MTRSQRWAFLQRHAMGLLPLTVIYLMVTIVRSIRSDFAPEIWRDLGSSTTPTIFSQSEFWVMLGVLVVNGSVFVIANNRWAFFTALATCGLGFCLMTAALLGYNSSTLNPFTFMVLIGLGLYFPYVAFHTTVFERMLAMTREQGNIGFLMYVVDSIGYLGYVAVLLMREFGPRAHNMLSLLTMVCWTSIAVSAACLVLSWQYFQGIERGSEVQAVEPAQGLA